MPLHPVSLWPILTLPSHTRLFLSDRTSTIWITLVHPSHTIPFQEYALLEMSLGLLKHHAMKTYEGKGPRDPLDRRLSGTHSRAAHCENRNLGLCQEHQTIIKLVILQFSPTSHYFLSPWTKYFTQHSVPKHPKWLSFTTIQNNK
jgi:hypothetical protein